MPNGPLQIRVLGGGCENCHNLEKNARAAAQQLGIEATFELTGDHAEYARYKLLYTPGLVVNGKLVSAGRVPDVAEVTSLIATALAEA
jgi:small redox-active disulfide protein 2